MQDKREGDKEKTQDKRKRHKEKKTQYKMEGDKGNTLDKREGHSENMQDKREGEGKRQDKREGEEKSQDKRDGDKGRTQHKRDGDKGRTQYKKDGDKGRTQYEREGPKEKMQDKREGEGKTQDKREGDKEKKRDKRGGYTEKTQYKRGGDKERNEDNMKDPEVCVAPGGGDTQEKLLLDTQQEGGEHKTGVGEEKVPETGSLKVYTLDEVSYHCEPSSCWIVLWDHVYDITSFIREHPGGEDIIYEHAGRDATSTFCDVGHSNDALLMIMPYEIGVLVEHEKIFKRYKTKSFSN